jgi:ATPase subunit of ABC transporter with duplicated ATPase domains
VRDLLVSVARPTIRDAAGAVDTAELAIMERDDEAAQLAYAQALSDWADAGGYAAETVWDMCTMSALGVPYEKAQWRGVATLSGGEQKRLVLEALLRGPDEVLLLDEPDNYLDVPGKRWLEEQLRETGKTVLFVSHDRELLARAASKIVSVEPALGHVGARRGVRQLSRGAGAAVRAVRGTAPPLGREACPAEEARARHAAVRGEQRRDGVPLCRRADAAAEVRGGGAAARAAAQAGHQDAAARRAHRRAGRHLRQA